jgi:phosphoribosyl 1,2-cyclic phosphodiesterase
MRHAAHPDPDGGCLSVCVLASGSKGNAIYIGNGQCAILIDAGLSGVEIQQRLHAAGLAAEDLTAIVVSHEHSDHIRGVGVLARRFHLPVYASTRTAGAAAAQWGRIDNLRSFEIGTDFTIDSLALHPFATSHDAADPAGFTVTCRHHKIGIATDLGIASGMVKHHLRECTLLVLEANHDPPMLTQGPYPWPLKQRIRSRNGHLSNEASRDLIGEIRHDGLRHVVLAHLSEINNTPEKALQAVQPALNSRTRLHVACQHRCTDLFIIH